MSATDPQREAPRPAAGFAILATVASLLFLAVIPASVALRPVSLGPPQSQAASGSAQSVGHAALKVVVHAQGGRVVPGATARAFLTKDRRYLLARATATNAQGVVSWTGMEPGAYWVIVDAPGLARSSTALIVEGTDRSVDLTLLPASTLRVTVEDERHEPVPDATVLVTGTDALPFGALTNKQGQVAVGRLGPSPWKIRVAARGFGSETRSEITGDATVVLHRASAFDVLVTDSAGAPVAGASVLIGGASLWPARSMTSAADGHAHMTGLEAGVYDFKAEKDDRVSKTDVGVRLDQGKTEPITLVLAPGRMLAVVVTDGEGEHAVLVPNADVWLVEGGVGSFPIQGRTNRFGSVTLGPVVADGLVAAARADGFIARGAVTVPDGIVKEVRVPLLRGATLRGTVVDADGRPVDGATIEVVGTDPDGMPIAATPLVAEFQRAHFEWALPGPAALLPAGELGVTVGAVPPIPTGPDPLLPTAVVSEPIVPGALASEPWASGRDGSFRANPIPPGRVRALVRHPSYVEGISETVDLGPGGTATVRVNLKSGGTMEGSVVDEAGIPVAGARVEVVAMEGTTNRATTTADDGTFAFPTLPGDVMISLARPEEPFRAVLRRRFQVPDGRNIEAKLVLPARRDAAEISVEDDSSRPVKMAQITVLSLDPERPLRTTAFTDEAGRASVGDAVGLQLRLVVEATGFARWTRQLDKAPSRISVELASGVLVEGRVTSVRGRRDVVGASVELLSDGQRRKTMTDADGRYRFSDVTPGQAHVTVSHPEYALADADVLVRSTGRADRSFDVDSIDLTEPTIIEGHVLDGDGRPVAGVRVRAGMLGNTVPMGANAPGTTTTDANGAFRLERVREGKVDVQAFSTKAGRGEATVDTAVSRSDVVIRLSTSAAESTEPLATGGVAVTLKEAGSGYLVVDVAENSEAERAGMLRGDRLISIDGVTPTSLDVARRLLSGPDGSDVVVEAARQDGHVMLRVRRERVRP